MSLPETLIETFGSVEGSLDPLKYFPERKALHAYHDSEDNLELEIAEIQTPQGLLIGYVDYMDEEAKRFNDRYTQAGSNKYEVDERWRRWELKQLYRYIPSEWDFPISAALGMTYHQVLTSDGKSLELHTVPTTEYLNNVMTNVFGRQLGVDCPSFVETNTPRSESHNSGKINGVTFIETLTQGGVPRAAAILDEFWHDGTHAAGYAAFGHELMNLAKLMAAQYLAEGLDLDEQGKLTGRPSRFVYDIDRLSGQMAHIIHPIKVSRTDPPVDIVKEIQLLCRLHTGEPDERLEADIVADTLDTMEAMRTASVRTI